jgi:hypothetical protein
MTSYAYTAYIRNMDSIRAHVQAQYEAVKERPAIKANLVKALNQYVKPHVIVVHPLLYSIHGMVECMAEW